MNNESKWWGLALAGASDFVEENDRGSFRAKCKKRIAHKVTPGLYQADSYWQANAKQGSRLVEGRGSPHLPPIQRDLPRELAR